MKPPTFTSTETATNKSLRRTLDQETTARAVVNGACKIADGMIRHAAFMTGKSSGGKTFTKAMYKKTVADARTFVDRVATMNVNTWNALAGSSVPWCTAFMRSAGSPVVKKARTATTIPPLPAGADAAISLTIGAMLLEADLDDKDKKVMKHCFENIAAGKKLVGECKEYNDLLPTFTGIATAAGNDVVTGQQVAKRIASLL